jgi:ribosomal protein L11 methyltransferase
LIENCPPELIPIKIDAGRAFGTGEHATTKGCLEMISLLKTPPLKILDVGTGTGVLAIACKKLWKDAEIFATDIDEVAVEIAKENAGLNDTNIKLAIKYSVDKSYDLIVSNILANPLIDMAGDFEKMLKIDGKLILSGFTKQQLQKLVETYSSFGFMLIDTISIDDWRIVLFTKTAHFS